MLQVKGRINKGRINMRGQEPLLFHGLTADHLLARPRPAAEVSLAYSRITRAGDERCLTVFNARAKIFSLDEKGISETTYEETEHYWVMRRFLNNHEKMVADLMADD
jgi:hypothetical protein